MPRKRRQRQQSPYCEELKSRNNQVVRMCRREHWRGGNCRERGSWRPVDSVFHIQQSTDEYIDVRKLSKFGETLSEMVSPNSACLSLTNSQEQISFSISQNEWPIWHWREYSEESCLSNEEHLDLDLNSGLVYLTNLKCKTQMINLVPSNLIKPQNQSSKIYYCSCLVAKSRLILLQPHGL